MFGCYLGNHNSGEITFGGYNQNLFRGNISWVPVVKRGFWEVQLSGLSSRGNSIAISGTRAAIDTGTSFILVPEADVRQINQVIGARPFTGGYYQVDCWRVELMPNLTLKLGSLEFTVPAKVYIVKLDGVCVSGFVGIKGGTELKDMWVVGNVFLRRYYSIYDMEKDRVGFAESINEFQSSALNSAKLMMWLFVTVLI
jgi:saccharopepsin